MTITAPPAVAKTSAKQAPDSGAAATGRLLRPVSLNRRRWQNFKSNRRGFWSFWIFLV